MNEIMQNMYYLEWYFYYDYSYCFFMCKKQNHKYLHLYTHFPQGLYDIRKFSFLV